MVSIYNDVCIKSSKLVTKEYSTSFSIGVRCLDVSVRDAIYSIYGFVRFADEIVDSFHDYDKELLLDEFERDYYQGLYRGISLNPILNSFLRTVKKYNIDDALVQAFLKSMKSDLYKSEFMEEDIEEYIYGSAEVVGLMCLMVFVNGDINEYEKLKPYAKRLGSAFQKINFLRDLNHDVNNLHRVYFPILRENPFNDSTKEIILDDIMEDYKFAEEGIRLLPDCAKLGVYTAYLYYYELTKQIDKIPAKDLMSKRVRVTNGRKFYLLCRAFLSTKLN